jgi:enterochelin esterase-like enzyme
MTSPDVALAVAPATPWFGHNIAQRSSYRSHHLVQQGCWHRRAKRTTREKLAVYRRNLFGEEHAVVWHTAGPRRKRDSRGAEPAAREYWHHDDIVGHAVANILGDDQCRPGLVRVVGLSRKMHRPDFAPAW